MTNDEIRKLVEQFKQIILQGPPGTGKTYRAKEIAEEITGKKNPGDRWEIIQFHPSYNYEDFVRGIQIKTEGEQIVYETVDRILVRMAKRAFRNKNNPYILIIDEINRADVAAVLGELIYALEYRGEPVSTPYEINSKVEIKLLKNLYIIGTMNTADRTIGHIDYAVRRRFAFVTLLPEREIVANQESKIAKAVDLFYMVAELFEKNNGCISPDYHPDDVAIGHSYFLVKDDEELKHKIKYQVIPILEEYVKDGVLLEAAKDKIKKIEEAVTESSNGQTQQPIPVQRRWRWKNNNYGTHNHNLSLRRLVLDVVRDYVKNENPPNLMELKSAFPDEIRPPYGIVQDYNDSKYSRYIKQGGDVNDRYFVKDLIDLPDGTKVMVCGEWGAQRNLQGIFRNLKNVSKNSVMKLSKYEI